jgi:DNA-binding GntR family transcriptional regulator
MVRFNEPGCLPATRGRTAIAATIRYRAAAHAEDLTDFRLLIELPAVRRLADRGLSDQELAHVQQLADATMRAARSGDLLGYLRADTVFHLCLLELASDPALCEVARLLLTPDRTCTARVSDCLMAREAREHSELAGLLADGMVSQADHLLRLHRSWLSADRPAAARLAGPESISAQGA